MTESTDPLIALGLNDKQARFVRAYCAPQNNFNATKAYYEAYGLCSESSYKTAQVNASKLLSKTIIQQAVDMERARILERHDDITNEILQKWWTMTSVSIFDFVDLHGQTPTIKPLPEIPPHLRPAIKSIVSTAHGINVTLHDKNKALENLAKVLGLFVDRVQSINEPYESLIERCERQRRKQKNKDNTE